MTIESPTALKAHFQTGDKPTQAQFENLIDSSIPELNVKHWGAVGDGSTNDAAAISAAITALTAAGGGNLIFPPSTGNYVINSTVTSGATVNWIMEGGIVEVLASTTINGGVSSRVFHRQCFKVASALASASLLKIRNVDAAGSIAAGASCSPYVDRMSPMWFDGASMSVKMQKVFQVGGAKTRCSIPPGHHTVTTTTSLSQDDYGSHLTLEGDAFLATTLTAAAGANLCVIDAASNSGGDECEIKNLRITEGTGQRTCIGIAIGGTSLKINDCWTGNLEFGLYMNRGSGAKITNHFGENCDYNVYIAPNDDQTGTISGAPTPSGGLADILFMGGQFTGGNEGVRIARAGSNIIRGIRFVGTSFRENTDYGVNMTDTAGTGGNGSRGTVFIGCEISGTLGGGSTLAGARIRNMDAVFQGCVFVENVNTGVIVEQTCNVLLMGCFFGNYSGTAQTADTAVNGGSPQIDNIYPMAI